MLIVMFAIVLASNLYANNLMSDTLARNSRVNSVSKMMEKKPVAVLSAEEIAFNNEMEAYFDAKYSNPFKVMESKLEKLVIVDAAGKTVSETTLSDHKVHEAQLPAGAEMLMTRGNTAYYIINK